MSPEASPIRPSLCTIAEFSDSKSEELQQVLTVYRASVTLQCLVYQT